MRPSAVHEIWSPTTFASETFRNSFFAASQTQTLTWLLPSRSEKNARSRLSGDQLGDQLLALPSIIFFFSPVFTVRTQMAVLPARWGTPVRACSCCLA